MAVTAGSETKRQKEHGQPRREMIMNRFAILAALVSLCAFAASPLKAEEPTTETPAATATPLPGPMAKAMQKMPSMMKSMPDMMRNMPGPMAKAMENFKPEDMKSLMGGMCPTGDCKLELPVK
jgi:hypothetical protein